MSRFLAIGECMIEMAPTSDGTYAMGFAGDTFNTAWYVRRLAPKELRVGYMSAIGNDEPSRQMEAFMREAGIEPHLAVRPGRSVGLYMIALRDGERSFSYWRESAAARTLADDLDALPGLEAGDIAMMSGITLAILPERGRRRLLDVLAHAREGGIQVAFDPNIRPRLWQGPDAIRRWTMAATEVADIVLPSHEDETAQFGDADPDATAARYRDAGAALVAVKDGAGPVVLLSREGRQTVTPEPVAQVVDTTAAGDAFNAGFLEALLSGGGPVAAARAACALSGRVIGARGALVPV